MKNLNPESNVMNTGMGETTSQETVKYSSQRGTEFEIVMIGNGLYRIEMKAGGKAPSFCDERFTSYRLAEKQLIRYLAKGDKIGTAVYPKKG